MPLSVAPPIGRGDLGAARDQHWSARPSLGTRQRRGGRRSRTAWRDSSRFSDAGRARCDSDTGGTAEAGQGVQVRIYVWHFGTIRTLDLDLVERMTALIACRAPDDCRLYERDVQL